MPHARRAHHEALHEVPLPEHHATHQDSDARRNPAPPRIAGNTIGHRSASTHGCRAASRTVPGGLMSHTGPTQGISALLGPLVLTAGLVMTLATLLAGCGDKTPPGEVVVMRACRICHGADRICADIGKLDRAGWEKTVDRMIAGGANVTPEERTVVIDWLSARNPGDKPLCP